MKWISYRCCLVILLNLFSGVFENQAIAQVPEESICSKSDQLRSKDGLNGKQNIHDSLSPTSLCPQEADKESQQCSKAMELLRQGRLELRCGHYSVVELLLQEAMAREPDNCEVCLTYARVLLKLGRAREAALLYEKILISYPDLQTAWIGAAFAYGVCGDLEQSLHISREFLQKFPVSADSNRMRKQADLLEKELERRLLRDSRSKSCEERSDNYLAQVISGRVRIWSKTPILVFVDSAENIPSWSRHQNEIVRQSFVEWGTASKGRLSFQFVDDPSKAYICCRWLSDPAQLQDAGEDGETRLIWTSTQHLQKATIKILLPFSNQLFQARHEFMIRRTSLHEIGHALGLAGHSNDPKDIMYFAAVDAIHAQLSPRDKKTIQMLYHDEIQPAQSKGKRHNLSSGKCSNR